jgi:hypothetical protein
MMFFSVFHLRIIPGKRKRKRAFANNFWQTQTQTTVCEAAISGKRKRKRKRQPFSQKTALFSQKSVPQYQISVCKRFGFLANEGVCV